MKKQAFTLSEILISLTIIGVVAAITSPLISGIIPDKDKVAVLKVYKTVTELNQTLLNDKSLYFRNNSDCVGFGCAERPFNPNFNDARFQNDGKYINLLVEHLELSIPPVGQMANGQGEFTTVDGITWNFNDFNRSPNGETLETTFEIDVDNNGGDCAFGDGCVNPDRFSFRVDERGRVTGADPLTRAYLANPNKMNDRKNDYAAARENRF